MIVRLLRFFFISVLLRRFGWAVMIRWGWRLLVLAGVTRFVGSRLKKAVPSTGGSSTSAWSDPARFTAWTPAAPSTAKPAAPAPAAAVPTAPQPAPVIPTAPKIDVEIDEFVEDDVVTDVIETREVYPEGPEIDTVEIVETAPEPAPVESKPAPPRRPAAAKPAPAQPEIDPQWVRADGDIDCPEDFPVKAKASSSIYYAPESGHYDRTVPDVCFASESDALAAGYRAPKR